MKNIGKILKEQRFLIALLLIQLFAFHVWIFGSDLFTFGDVGVLTPEAQKQLFTNALSVYFPDSNFGSMNITASTNPFLFLFGLFGSLSVGYAMSMKLLIFYPTVFSVVVASYFLVLKITQSKEGAFFGALFYSYNTYFLITLTGALYISLAYALAPGAFLLFILLLEKPTISRGVLLALFLAIIGYVEFRVLYIVIGILGIYFLSDWLIRKRPWLFMRARLGVLSFSGALLATLNLFWILPLMLSSSISHNVLFNRGLFGNSYFDVLNAFALFHPWWTGGVPSIFIKQEAAGYFLVFPILFFTLFFLTRSHRKVLPFFILFAVGVFLTKQAGAPFEDLYLWLYRHIPGFNAFREASKFFLMTSLAGSVLVGLLFTLQKQDRFTRGIFFGISTCFSIFFLAQVYTVATSSLGTLFIPRSFPVEYVKLNAFLNADARYGRVLWVPHMNRFGTYSNEHPAVSLLTNVDGLFNKFVDNKKETLEEALVSALDEEEFFQYLSENSVRYIVVPSNLVWDDVDSPWRDPERYIRALDRVEGLEKIQGGDFGNVTVYENKLVQPHIFFSTSASREAGEGDIIIPEVSGLSPTQFSVQVQNVDQPLYLHFSESFNPGWLLKEGDFSYVESFYKDRETLGTMAKEGSSHTNLFEIVSKDTKSTKENVLRVTPQEGESISLTLYFAPQRYYLLGLTLSFLALFLALGYLGYGRMTNKNKENF